MKTNKGSSWIGSYFFMGWHSVGLEKLRLSNYPLPNGTLNVTRCVASATWEKWHAFMMMMGIFCLMMEPWHPSGSAHWKGTFAKKTWT